MVTPEHLFCTALLDSFIPPYFLHYTYIRDSSHDKIWKQTGYAGPVLLILGQNCVLMDISHETCYLLTSKDKKKYEE